MRQAVGNGTGKTNRTSISFEPEFLMRYWQHGGVRTARAGERILRGWAAAAQLEMELTQAFMEYHLTIVQSPTLSHMPSSSAPSADRLMRSFRQISDELWNGVEEAMSLFFNDESIKFTDCAMGPGCGNTHAQTPRDNAQDPKTHGTSVHSQQKSGHDGKQ